MYRLLEVGEVIEKGDEYYGIEDKWLGFPPSCVGMKTVPHDAPIRRLVTTAASSVPDPVVSVGDRVNVLSGPWAGCTGVVVEDWGKPKPDGKFEVLSYSVRFDFVFVGGPQLETIIWGTDLERLPPVVPEVLYRDLSHGETIRIEDEYLFCGSWLAGSTEPRHVGRKLEKWHVRHRRPVRLQSPGWRYLDAGETVQDGDEAGFHTEPIWRHALEYFSAGYAVRGLDKEHSETFRRKLPTNQGG